MERRAPRTPRLLQARSGYKLALALAAPLTIVAVKTWRSMEPPPVSVDSPVSRRELGDSLAYLRRYTDSLHAVESAWSNQIIDNLLSVNALVCEQTRTTNRQLYNTVTRTNPHVHCP